MIRFFVAMFITTIATLALATAASAHAKIDHCNPALGSAGASAPSEVRCWFSEEIDKTGTLKVSDAKDQRVDNDDAKLDLNDVDRKQLFVTLKPLTEGVYKVDWRVVSADDNVATQGAWYFGVGNVSIPTPDPSQIATPKVAAPFASQTTTAPIVPAIPTAGATTDNSKTYIVAAFVLLAAGGIALIVKRVIK